MKFAAVSLLATLLMMACSSTEKEVKPEPPPTPKPTGVTSVEPDREFTYNERYYVKGAAIGDPTDVDDALQAIRVIQLKEGSMEVVVISSFDKQEKTSLETWMAIELPSFGPGKYNLATASKFSFYRFYLGEEKKRIDGESCEGTLTVESNNGGEIIGSIDATVHGTSKSFDTPSKPVMVKFTGSFRIQQANLEDTIMKTRN